MKNLLKLAICAGLTTPLLSSAVVVSDPSPSLTFVDLVNAMAADAGDLFTTEGESLSVTSPIYFNRSSLFPSTSGDWDAVAAGANPIQFELVANFPAFTFSAGGTLDVGFIGEESTHDNEFGFSEGGSYTKLFDYNAGGDTAPMTTRLTTVGATQISFEHKNLTEPDEGDQSQADRFRIYRVREDGELTNQYLFAVADRDGNKDADYDDGFFYIVGDINPVPEPSHIAALAFMGLGALLVIRRRITKKKA